MEVNFQLTGSPRPTAVFNARLSLEEAVFEEWINPVGDSDEGCEDFPPPPADGEDDSSWIQKEQEEIIMWVLFSQCFLQQKQHIYTHPSLQEMFGDVAKSGDP